MNKIYTLRDLPKISREMLSLSKSNILLFYGNMGVGKTTLIKEACRQLGVKSVISSPTFSLVNEYKNNKGKTIYHFDFYRINSEEEVWDMGIEEYFYSGALCLIEWPDKIKNLLPLQITKIQLTELDYGKRNIQLN